MYRPSPCFTGMTIVCPGSHRIVNGVSERSTRRGTSRQTKRSDSLRRSAPGSRPASQRTWNPLQIPSTSPPPSANAHTAAVAGEKRAIAPQRR